MMKLNEYREKQQHGSTAFPVQYYFVDESFVRYVMPLHWHSEAEILRVRSGTFTLYLNNECYHLTAGDVVWISPGTLHRGEPNNCIYECAVFDLRVACGYSVSKISALIQPIISSRVTLAPICEATVELTSQLMDILAEQAPYYELAATAVITTLLYRFYTVGAVTHEVQNDKRILHHRARMALLVDKIERDYATKITLRDLAELAGMNEKYLCRFFKSYTGSTPIEFVNRLRVERACHEITVNQKSVTDVAYECGFNELSYFSKIFKKYKGVTPGSYKRQHTHDKEASS